MSKISHKDYIKYQVYGMRQAIEKYKWYRERASEEQALEKVLEIASDLEWEIATPIKDPKGE